MTYPKVLIIVLNWNNYEDTKECLESLEKIIYSNHEVIIVDNASTDKSTQKIQKEFPQHTYLYNKDNLGFTGGNNVGMEYAIKKGTDFIFTSVYILIFRIVEKLTKKYTLISLTIKDALADF